ncbi:type III pantothenate kinase [Acidicapsa acidisoli]|uniref:type III pantothenate kinase n=1 Tax=Acidicapsa acidisoli TaxID=1615681 RepID=UPI0021DFD049|nr:type III pantothenate kinase [Acidicapsa acidisoli]
MLLALDVGNTNTVLGLYSLASALDPSSNSSPTLVAHWRVSTHRTQTADEYGVLFTNLFNLHGLATTQVHHIIISSVVPPVESTLLQVCESYFKIKPLFVEPGIKTGMPVLVDNPAELGADRLVNAIAAYEKYGAASKGPVIVVDFGTATTFDVISAKGEYLGGIISPGLGISADALFSRAARLGRVDIKRPPKVIGTTTVTHIQSGLYYGYIGLVDGILERMIAEMAEDPRCGRATPKILATGGLSTLIAGDSRYISTIDDMLTLEGLRLVFARNRPDQTGAGSAITGKPSRPRKRSN